LIAGRTLSWPDVARLDAACRHCNADNEETVDLWDLARLLIRRWLFAVPMLLLSLVGVLMVSSTVAPDYSASGHLQLLPAPGDTDPNPGSSASKAPPRVHNPWADLGYQALGQAAIVKVEDDSVAKSLKAAGLSTNFTVTIEYGTSFFSIEAVGTSSAQASATVQQVMKVLTDLVEAEQTRFGVLKQDQITTLALDKGETVKVVTSKKKRVLIVSAGIAVLVTAGSAIGLDALLRLRERRRARPRAVIPAAVVKSVARAGRNSPPAVEDSTSTQVVMPVSPAVGTMNGYLVGPTEPPVSAGAAVNSQDFSPMRPDATVVLPRPNGWSDERTNR
jgi:capsular polysaccharide biosynthesis protein